jgi:hypothetical protein
LLLKISKYFNNDFFLDRKIGESDVVDVYRAWIKTIDDASTLLSVDLFDYEINLQLRSSMDGHQYLCDDFEDSHFEIKAFPVELLDFGCPVVRIKLDGIPADLKPYGTKDLRRVEEKFNALQTTLQNKVCLTYYLKLKCLKINSIQNKSIFELGKFLTSKGLK